MLWFIDAMWIDSLRIYSLIFAYLGSEQLSLNLTLAY
jgi:hypothetical protein